MIYEPNAYENAEYFEAYTEGRIYVVAKELIDRKDELCYDDRIDVILAFLDWMGYTWAEYQEERQQQQYYQDMKRQQIEKSKKERQNANL